MGIRAFFKTKQYDIDTGLLGAEPLTGMANQTILQAAESQGLDLPHSCRVGGCGACKCKLKSGKIKALTEAAYVLTEEELQQGYILTCQSQPRSALVLEPAESVSHSSPLISATLKNIEPLTGYIFKITLALKDALAFKGGQYVEVWVPGFQNPRCYSLTNGPQDTGHNIELFIQQCPGGSLSNWLTDHHNLNAELEISQAQGSCTLDGAQQSGPLFFASTGSGFAPILSLLKQGLHESCERDAHVLLGAKTHDDLYAMDELKAIQDGWAGDLHIHQVLSQQADSRVALSGRIQNYLPKLLSSFEPLSMDAFICGNSHMVESVCKEFVVYGLRVNQLHLDKFIDQPINQAKKILVNS